MTDLRTSELGARAGRVASRITRRAVGFVLLVLTVGLTTCSALDATRDDAAQRTAIEEIRS
ncbi:MAG: hypothetical protein AAFU65_07595 [Pseudomonadota bacterium]